MTNETKAVIDTEIEELFNKIEQSILIGASETVGPNSNEYISMIEENWVQAMNAIMDKMDHYQGDYNV